MIDRAEATGFGIAFAGHAALLAALSLGLAAVHMPKPQNAPIEVSLVDEVALESASPTPSAEAPAPKLGEVEGPAEPTPPAPAPMPEPTPLPQVEPRPQPQVQPKPTPPAPAPAPTPRPVPRPQPKPNPPQAKAAPPRPVPKQAAAAPAAPSAKASAPNNRPPAKAAARPTGNLKGLLAGVGDAPAKSKAPAAAPGAKASPAVTASLGAELKRQLKPHWRSPTGADAELLVTTVTVSLARDGSVASIGEIRTTGLTASNRSQVKLHQEQAVRAVRLAAPFRFPVEYYDAWKVIRPNFDRRLSQ